ncbi:MAG: sodium-independent anion transporter [Bryobacterales bacterium]
MPTAIVLSLLAHTRHGYRPKNLVLAGAKDGRWRGVPVSEAAQLVPGLLVYRFTHSMYYANAEFLSDQIRSLVDKAQPPLSWFCIDAGAIDDVDFTAAETLLVIAGFLRKNGIRLVLAEVAGDVKDELDRSGITDVIGEAAYYPTVSDAVKDYRSRTAARC